MRAAQLQREAAAFGDFQRVGQRRRHIGKQRLHLFNRLEILLAGELAHALGVAQNFALGNANTRLVRFVVVVGQKLHRVRRHNRQAELRGQLHSGDHVALVVGAFGALQLQIKAPRKHRGKVAGGFCGAHRVALNQRLTDRAALRA